MTMLTHARGPFERTRYSSRSQSAVRAGSAAAHLAMIRRFCIGAVTILAAASGVAVIMALKIAIYLPRFIHH
jgi:hypothetical protein